MRINLRDVCRKAGESFSGVGLIVYEEIDRVRAFPLRDTFPNADGLDVTDVLADMSTQHSEYHDGFHLVTTDWELTHVSQYLSPPIATDCQIAKDRCPGGRYLTALFASRIPGVTLTGIVRSDLSMSIFENGREVHYEKLGE